jgi:hypothetical protein
MTASSIKLNHIVLGHPIVLFPLNFNPNALLGIFIISIVFALQKHCTCFCSVLQILNSSSYKNLISNSTLSCFPPQYFSEMLYHCLGFIYVTYVPPLYVNIIYSILHKI